MPQVDKIFTLSPMGKIEFAIASPAITPADLDRVRDKGAPIGLFHEWMRLMMRWSNDSASSRCILALGYFYINGLFATSGFFNAGKGLWISGDYATHDWVRTEAGALRTPQALHSIRAGPPRKDARRATSWAMPFRWAG